MIIWILAQCAYAELSSSAVLEQLLTDYDASASPSNSTLDVDFFLEVSHIFSFAEDTNHFDMIFGYTAQWTDTRLDYSELSSATVIELHGADLALVWRPNLAILNLLEFEEVIYEKVSLFRNGRVGYFLKGSGYLACNYNFELMPYDTHTCDFRFINLDSPESPTRFRPVDLREGSSTGFFVESSVHLPEWEIEDYSLEESEEEVLGRRYSGICGRIRVNRRQTYNLFFIEIPGFLIVTLAYSSFWIDYRASPSRTTLAVITVLTSLTQLYNTFRDYPKIGYSTWILRFLYINATCTIFAMLEYALVSRLHVRHEAQAREARRRKKILTVQMEQVGEAENSQEEVPPERSWKRRFLVWLNRTLHCPPQLADDVCRVSFPIVYSALMLDLFGEVK